MFDHRTTQPLAARLREINPRLTIRQSHALAMHLEALDLELAAAYEQRDAQQTHPNLGENQ